ncbi:hypothetical protein CYMTET_49154 [Cymbomonas tetramitiformis]|uniref:Uncharacterized protein n=1 Tax=Cymbomonas tetramitiformis TaxID=36881 RepID=A0AAE0BQT5_9CHLO|nr:hypothetical protein CYMTET_49154 [Cymbomonas tetramitiformis]
MGKWRVISPVKTLYLVEGDDEFVRLYSDASERWNEWKHENESEDGYNNYIEDIDERIERIEESRKQKREKNKFERVGKTGKLEKAETAEKPEMAEMAEKPEEAALTDASESLANTLMKRMNVAEVSETSKDNFSIALLTEVKAFVGGNIGSGSIVPTVLNAIKSSVEELFKNTEQVKKADAETKTASKADSADSDLYTETYYSDVRTVLLSHFPEDIEERNTMLEKIENISPIPHGNSASSWDTRMRLMRGAIIAVKAYKDATTRKERDTRKNKPEIADLIQELRELLTTDLVDETVLQQLQDALSSEKNGDDTLQQKYKGAICAIKTMMKQIDKGQLVAYLKASGMNTNPLQIQLDDLTARLRTMFENAGYTAETFTDFVTKLAQIFMSDFSFNDMPTAIVLQIRTFGILVAFTVAKELQQKPQVLQNERSTEIMELILELHTQMKKFRDAKNKDEYDKVTKLFEDIVRAIIVYDVFAGDGVYGARYNTWVDYRQRWVDVTKDDDSITDDSKLTALIEDINKATSTSLPQRLFAPETPGQPSDRLEKMIAAINAELAQPATAKEFSTTAGPSVIVAPATPTPDAALGHDDTRSQSGSEGSGGRTPDAELGPDATRSGDESGSEVLSESDDDNSIGDNS